MSEINAVLLEEGGFIGQVSGTDGVHKRSGRADKFLKADQFLGDFIEVAAGTLDGCPSRRPSSKIFTINLGTDDRVKVVKEKQKLG